MIQHSAVDGGVRPWYDGRPPLTRETNKSEHNMLTTESSYRELAERLAELKKIITDRDNETKVFKEELEYLVKGVLPAKMDAEGVSTVNVKDVGRITVTNQMSVSCLSNKQPLLRQWMRENGYGELISETINPSTLKAWLKERISDCDDYPADILDIYSYQQASLTKK